jgi:hypothetical protein
MAVHTIIPNGATFQDVADTLSANGGTGITSAQASSMFTTDAIKAAFSKKKPMLIHSRFDKHFPDRTDEWWKGYNGLCGFDLTNANCNGLVDNIRHKYNGDMNGWVYEPPTGGESNPYRIADFAGYYPDASPFAYDFYVQNKISDSDTEVEAQVVFLNGGDYALSFSDFGPLAGYYFGIYLYGSNGALHLTASSPISEGAERFTFNPNKLPVGEYTVYPFICSRKLEENALPSSGDVIYSLPKIQPIGIEITSGAVLIKFLPSAQYSNGTGTGSDIDSVAVSLRITNDSGATITSRENYVTLKYKLNGEVYTTRKIADITAPAGVSYHNLVTITGVPRAMRNNCKVLITLDNNNEKYAITEFEPTPDTSNNQQQSV